MSKLQDNRTTPQFMGILEKWAFFTLNLHFQQIRSVRNSTLYFFGFFCAYLYFVHLEFDGNLLFFCLLRKMRSRVEISLFIDLVQHHSVWKEHKSDKSPKLPTNPLHGFFFIFGAKIHIHIRKNYYFNAKKFLYHFWLIISKWDFFWWFSNSLYNLFLFSKRNKVL